MNFLIQYQTCAIICNTHGVIIYLCYILINSKPILSSVATNGSFMFVISSFSMVKLCGYVFLLIYKRQGCIAENAVEF